MRSSRSARRTVLACVMAAGVLGCATSRTTTTSGPAADSRYLYRLLDARKLGAGELARIEQQNPVVAGYVARTGKPDFLIEPSLTDLQLVYYSRSLLVHFHQGADGVWTSSERTPLPTGVLNVLPTDIRAGTPSPLSQEIGCWDTTVPGGTCKTCCTPPGTPVAQSCTIQCQPGRR